MLTNDQLRQLLEELPKRGTRSGLERYRELVLEMRRRKYSYREISRLLTERCGFQISHSTIHDFVKRHCHEPAASPASCQQTRSPATLQAQSGERRCDSEEPTTIRERIAAMKRQPQPAEPHETGFRFDPAQPLRLEDEKEKG